MLLSPGGDDLVLSTEPRPKPHIVDAIGRAYRWHKGLSDAGLSIRDYAEKIGASRSRMLKLLPLTCLGPEVLRHALHGTLPPSITLDDLLAAARDIDWDRQAKSLGLDRLPAVRAAG